MKNFQHIDCTLRDGGYYNNWFFSKKLVRSYISTMFKIGIKNVEIGFWSPKKNIDFGLYGNIPNKLLGIVPPISLKLFDFFELSPRGVLDFVTL